MKAYGTARGDSSGVGYKKLRAVRQRGGFIFSVVQYQECGRWCCLGFLWCLQAFDQGGKDGSLGRIGGCQRALGRSLVYWR